MSDVRWVEIGGWDGEDAEARHRREVAWAESHWSGRHPFSRFRRPNDSMEDQVSNEEGENTASPVPLEEVEQAWETIRRFGDWQQLASRMVVARVVDHQGVVEHLIKERDEARENLAQVRRDNADMLDANTRLRRERDVLNSTLALVQEQYDEARTDRAKAIAERDAVRNDCDAVIKQRNDVREERDQARKTRDDLTSAVATLRGERAAILEILGDWT